MFEKIIILTLFIISFLYMKYIIKKYRENCNNSKMNILLFDYSVYKLNVFIYFLIPFYIFIILFITIFWNTDSIDKILTTIMLLLFLLILIIFILIILRKKIIIEENVFTLSTLFYTKKFEYKGLEVYYNRGNIYIYKGKKKLLKLNCYIKNFQLLVDMIIKKNGFECIKK